MQGVNFGHTKDHNVRQDEKSDSAEPFPILLCRSLSGQTQLRQGGDFSKRLTTKSCQR